MHPSGDWKISLGHLRRNSRKRSDKKSGRKCPRKGDITFHEAPDSCLAEAQNASMVSDAESVNSPASERTKRVHFTDDLECHNSTSESVTASGMPSLSEFVVTDGMTSTPNMDSGRSTNSDQPFTAISSAQRIHYTRELKYEKLTSV